MVLACLMRPITAKLSPREGCDRLPRQGAARLDGDWRVRFGDREAQARFLDYALAEVLGIPSGQAIPLSTKIVRELPPEPINESADRGES